MATPPAQQQVPPVGGVVNHVRAQSGQLEVKRLASRRHICRPNERLLAEAVRALQALRLYEARFGWQKPLLRLRASGESRRSRRMKPER